MQTFLAILLILAMGATLFALVRGVIAFLRTSSQDLAGEGPSQSSLKQNRAMQMRIFFQAIAIVIVALILLLSSGRS